MVVTDHPHESAGDDGLVAPHQNGPSRRSWTRGRLHPSLRAGLGSTRKEPGALLHGEISIEKLFSWLGQLPTIFLE